MWSPSNVGDIHEIERVQHRFTWKICQRIHQEGLEYREWCHILELESLEIRRLRADLIMCFKIVHGIVNLRFGDFFTYAHSKGRRHNRCLYVLSRKKEVRSQFFSLRVVPAWNSLPNSLVNINGVKPFAHALTAPLLIPFLNVYDF